MRVHSLNLPPQALQTTHQLGVALRSRRKALQLTQAEVGAKVGMSQNRLSELELAPEELNVKQLMMLLSVLGLELTLQVRDAKPRASSGGESKDSW